MTLPAPATEPPTVFAVAPFEMLTPSSPDTARISLSSGREPSGYFFRRYLFLAPFTVSVGSWVQPDAVLFFFLTAAALPIVELAFDETRHPLRQWVIAGLWFGLAMLSKYHSALILAGTRPVAPGT